jgi:hypothetical protein
MLFAHHLVGGRALRGETLLEPAQPRRHDGILIP